ncbi:MAG: two-component regulator propeller domain-containing protein, partial [Calditrichaceae bacterium]
MKNIFIILILIILFSCEKSDRKDLSNIDTTVVSDSINSDNVLSIEIREKAPAWFKSLPVKEGYIYAVGTAKSRRASIASDKALLNAQVSLAEELKQLEQGSGMEETQGADVKNKRKLLQRSLVLKFFACVAISTLAFAEVDQPTFEHLSLEKGISHNLTRCIIQDNKGFMWFGTMFGLIKFDGLNYIAYRNHPGDSLSLSHDDILCMIEDRNKYLWIGTRGGGLNRFDPRTKTFIRFSYDSNDSTSLSNNFINTLCEDSLGNLWIGTDFGLNKLDKKYLDIKNSELRREKVSFTRYNSNLWNIQSISDDIIKSILYSDGYVWIGTKNGFNKFDPVSKVFKRYNSYNPSYTKVYLPKVFDRINILKNENKLLVSILKPGHYANIRKEFFLPDSANVLVYCQGEGRSEFRGEPVMAMRDFGSLEKYENNAPIWRMTFKQSKYAGGAEKNRVQINVLTLSKGKYKLRYQSDDSHAFDSWNNTPPNFPQDWGI